MRITFELERTLITRGRYKFILDPTKKKRKRGCGVHGNPGHRCYSQNKQVMTRKDRDGKGGIFC